MASPKMAMAAVLVAALVAGLAKGQSTTSCVQKLTPCVKYLNGTAGTPPATCCTPVKEAVANEKECLCSLYSTPGLLENLGVNSTQVADLAKSCGVNADVNTICPGSAPSPTAPTAGTPGNRDSASSRITRIGIPSMFLLWASFILFF